MTAVATYFDETFSAIVSDCIVTIPNGSFSAGDYRIVQKLESDTSKKIHFSFIGDEVVREAVHGLLYWSDIIPFQLQVDSAQFINNLVDCANCYLEAHSNLNHPHIKSNSTVYIVRYDKVVFWDIIYNVQGNRFWSRQTSSQTLQPQKIHLNYGGAISHIVPANTPKTSNDVFEMLKDAIETQHIKLKAANSAQTLPYDFLGYFSGVVFTKGQNISLYHPFQTLSDEIFGGFGEKNNIASLNNPAKKWNPK